ncbi:MAG TPA: toprim domain-containing protein [Gemmataceae bacterium]|nr:toprim domain-containing protein [Gemmataceae bacterium]
MAYAFPMSDAKGRVVGIRLRRPDGIKLAVRGGREGLFLPTVPSKVEKRLLICEGPTDAAALLDLGYSYVVGRPSCTGGVKLLVQLAQKRRWPEAVIVADADEPGRRGADSLASLLVCYVPEVRVIVPPGDVKDVRDFLKGSGKRTDVEAAIDAAPVRRLRVMTRRVTRERPPLSSRLPARRPQSAGDGPC